MRYTRLIHAGLLLMLLTLDFLVQTVFNLRGFPELMFVSQLHFMALLMMTKEDSRLEIFVKVILVCFFMDLVHYQSFPIFYISYGIAAIVIRIWYRHIGETHLELSLLMALGLFIKEFVMYILLYVLKDQNVLIRDFLVNRAVWVVLGNLCLLPVSVYLFRGANKMINKITYR